ncbi:DUF6773 family protein [Clostridium tepidum]|uniref:Uncharacterized protein n=1 Tax=Clostridium tepidum TaxID=1962263 RepID=A0ABX3L0L7_9CLOT|nr:DUF6773 family protein [Clostridium tepidum]OOO61252.1 hypothetical protein BS637_13190 [Clostridium tepidum]
MKLFSNNGDERTQYQLQKYGYQTTILILILLISDVIAKIILNQSFQQYRSSFLIFIIGLYYFGMRIILGKIVVEPREKGKVLIKKRFISSGFGFIIVTIFNIISRQSIRYIIFNGLVWFGLLYILTILISKIGYNNAK